MTILGTPTKTMPDEHWEHYEVWKGIFTVFYSLPIHPVRFSTEQDLFGCHHKLS